MKSIVRMTVEIEFINELGELTHDKVQKANEIIGSEVFNRNMQFTDKALENIRETYCEETIEEMQSTLDCKVLNIRDFSAKVVE